MMRYGFLFFLLLSLPAMAQRPCATGAHAINEKLRDYFPGGKYFESAVRSFRDTEEKSVTSDNDSVYNIPVVVHILHNGEPEGSGRNLSAERIQSQISILNQDYSREPGSPGFNSHPAGVDTRIRFCLASQDPDGNPSNGVVRVNTGVDAFDIFTQNAFLKGFSFWNPEKYLNIWVCKIQGNFIGYAQYPMISPEWADSIPMIPNIEDVQPDGVVIEYRVFGDVPQGESGPYPAYNKGRTASHEIGHYLGLLHIWGDGFSCLDNKTDYCSDTPQQATYTSGCPSPAPESCLPPVKAMIENYMDYTNDGCMNIFTSEQKKRMRIVLRNCIRRKTVKSTSSSCGISATEPLEPGSIKKSIRLVSDPEGKFVEVIPSGIEIKEVSVFDLYGRKISAFEPESNFASYSTRVKIPGLRPGTYFVRVKDGSGIARLASFRHF
jgi:hypothetical protein